MASGRAIWLDMTKTMNHGELAAGIEHLVREYIATIRRSAEAAVERAVAGSVGAHATSRFKKPLEMSARPRGQGKRRAAEDIVALGERFYQALCRSPGESMTVLAPIVGARPRELNRSTLLLTFARRAGA